MSSTAKNSIRNSTAHASQHDRHWSRERRTNRRQASASDNQRRKQERRPLEGRESTNS